MSPGLTNWRSIVLNQDAVLWANANPEGAGGREFDDPVAIKTRWERKAELFRNSEGTELVSQHVVYVDRDVEEGDMLMLGTLADVGGEALSHDGAHEVKGFSKIPDLVGSGYTRKAML